MIERKPMGREEFINKVANWLPETKFLYLTLLRMESQGRIRFVRDEQVPTVLWKNGRFLMNFAEG
jgi:hypothetical protein